MHIERPVLLGVSREVRGAVQGRAQGGSCHCPPLSTLIDDRRVQSLQAARLPADASHDVMGALVQFGFHGLGEEDLGRLCGADAHEEELIVMAETAAYFHVAYEVPSTAPSPRKRLTRLCISADHRQRPADHRLRLLALHCARDPGLAHRGPEHRRGERVRACLAEDSGAACAAGAARFWGRRRKDCTSLGYSPMTPVAACGSNVHPQYFLLLYAFQFSALYFNSAAICTTNLYRIPLALVSKSLDRPSQPSGPPPRAGTDHARRKVPRSS